VRDFSTGLNWQEKNSDPDANLAAGAAYRLPKVAKVAQEQVEPIDNPKPEEKTARRDDESCSPSRCCRR
jgi:hypothetical protein